MTFLTPQALWAATLVLPIIALHILKAQRTQVVVSSTLDWEDVERPVAAARPWQRLRWSLPLILQLLVVLLLAAALAQPAWDTGRVSAQHVIVMLDTSASMGSADGSPDRISDAVNAVRDVVSEVGSGTRVSLITTGAPARIVASEVSPSEIDARLESLRPSEGGFDAEATGSLALSLDRPDRSVENVLVSDGGLDDSAIRLLPAGTRYVRVGRSATNLGVTNVVVSSLGESLHVQATITNSGDRAATAVARFDVDGRNRQTASIKIPAHESAETAADVAAGDRVEVLLEGSDALRLDDHAYAVGPTLSKVRALVVGEADPFVEALLASNPRVTSKTITPVEFAASGSSAFSDIDFAIFDRSAVPDSVPVPYLAISPPGGSPAVSVIGSVESPVPTLIREDTDLISGIDLSGLAIATAQKVEASGATTLVGAEGAPLIISGRDGDSPFVYLAMALPDSNLGLLAAFPALGDRIISSLGQTDLLGGDVHAGDQISLDAGTEAVITSPTGTETTVRPGAATPEFDRTGFWTIVLKGQKPSVVVVNPDPAETQIAPVKDLAIPGVRGGLDGDAERVTFPFAGWLLGAALLCLIAEWWVSRGRRGVSRRQWRWSEYARVIIAILLIVAILAPSFHRSNSDVAVVFVVDVSDSMTSSSEEVSSLVKSALETQPDGAVAGVVVVGATARVDAAVRSDLRWSSPGTEVDGSATDLAAGLRIAGALVPTDHARRVVLVSDGRPTSGTQIATEASRLRDAGIAVDAISVDPSFGDDVSVISVDAPSRARPADNITVSVNVSSSTRQKAAVALLRDGKEVDRRLVELPAGSSAVDFVQPAGDSATVAWTARISGPNNGVFENDESRASTRIEGRPRVLVVEGTPGNGANLVTAFAAGGVVSTTTTPEQLGDLTAVSSVDAVVLVDVAAARLSATQTLTLSRAVRDLGTGLLVIGGTSSFGAGDYLGSPLEELLPVVSEAKDPKRRSKVSEVFAVDVSGSMGACHCADDADGSNSRLAGGVTKTDIARDSVVRSLDGFQPDDELGILALDERQRWVLDLAPVGDRKTARKQMNKIATTGGQTNLGPSLQMAADRLRNSSGTLRHIVLFSDGFTAGAELGKLADEAEKLRNEGITVSVMGTGEGASERLRDIAEAGGGRYYAGRDLKELPNLLLQETKVVARSLIQEGDFLPEISSSAAVVSELTESPTVRGYVATTARPTATQHLRVGSDKDPLLASWRAGLGQVAAWTSDAGQRWSTGWTAWDGAVPFWTNVVKSVLPTPAGSADLRFSGASGTVTASFDQDVPDGAKVTAKVVSPDGSSQNVRLERVDATTFSGTVDASNAGTYAVGVTATVGGTIERAISTTAELGYSREYLSEGADKELLRSLSSRTKGRGLIKPTQAFDAESLTPGQHRVELRWWLVAAALLMWPFVVALSRLRRRNGDLAVAGARAATPIDDLTQILTSRRPRRQSKPSPSSTDVRSAPASSPAAPPASSTTSSTTPPASTPTPPAPPGPTVGSASTVDSLLAAKRRRER